MAAPALLAAAAALLLGAAHAATVNIISPSFGSLAGGTRVVIWGAGFATGPMGAATNVRVYVGAGECVVEPYYSSDSKITCYTPPSLTGVDNEVVPVQVVVTSLDGTDTGIARCATGGTAPCTFKYMSSRTPYISALHGGGPAGSVLRLTGWTGVTDVSRIEITQQGGGPGGAGREETHCEVTPEVQRTDGAGNLPWGGGAVNCTVGPSIAGHLNVSYRVEDPMNADGWGAARMTRRSTRVVPDGSSTTFHTTAVPRVTGLSYNGSGVLGGDPLVITGTGFSPLLGDNAVSLAGVPCAVTAATRTSLTCVPGATSAPGGTPAVPVLGPNATYYPGARGLLRRVWLGNSAPRFRVDPPSFTEVESATVAGMSIRSRLDYYAQELSGYFVPPFTAEYSWFLRGDDTANLYVGTNASSHPAAERPVALLRSWCPDFQCNATAQISRPLALQGGVPVWWRLTHSEGNGEDSIEVGLRIHSSSNPAAVAALRSPAQRAFASVPEMQILRITTPQVRTAWTCNITGAAHGMVNIRAGATTIATVNATQLRSWSGVTTYVSNPLATAYNIPGYRMNTASWSQAAANRTTSWLFSVQVDSPLVARAPWPALSVTPVTSMVQQNGWVPATVTCTQTADATMPLEGWWRLRYGGVTANRIISIPTLGVSMAQPLGDVRAALAQLGFPEAEVQGFDMTGGNNVELRVTLWQAPGGDVAPLEVVLTDENGAPSVTGTSVAATVTTSVHGTSDDPFYWPPPAEWFRLPAALPQVVVTTRGIDSTCALTPAAALHGANASVNSGSHLGTCSFVFAPALTPKLVAASAVNVSSGDVLTLTGSGFLAADTDLADGSMSPAAAHTVYFGATAGACAVTASTASSLTCFVSDAPYGSYDVRVLVGRGRGWASLASADGAPLRVTYRMGVAGFGPAAGSQAGGTLLNVTGTGFRYETGPAGGNAVTVAGRPCAVVSSTFTSLTCRTPAAPAAADSTVDAAADVVVNGVAAGSFTYRPALTPQLLSMSPAALSSAVSGVVNMTLAGVPLDGSAPLRVTFTAPGGATAAPRTCTVTSVAPTADGNVTLSCTLVRSPPATAGAAAQAPLVEVGAWGYAANPAPLALDASYYVAAVSPAVANIEGGTLITLTGAGFGGRLGAIEPSFDFVWPTGEEFSIPCAVASVAADGSSLSCVLRKAFVWQRIPRSTSTPLNGTLTLRINNVTAPCDAAVCAFVMSDAATPVVTGAAVDAVTRTLTLTGTGLGLADPATVTISVGAYTCGSVAASTVSDAVALTCALPSGLAGVYPLAVAMGPAGSARLATPLNVALPFAVTPPDAGTALPLASYAGGARVRLFGRGWGNDTSLWIVNVTSVTGPAVPQATAFVAAAAFDYVDIVLPPLTQATGVNSTEVAARVWLVNASAPGGLTQLVTATPFSIANYSMTVTPSLHSVRPNRGGAGTVLNVTGRDFGAVYNNATTVTIGGGPCAVIPESWNATFFRCVVGAVPAGWHRVLVAVGGVFGNARVPSTVSSERVNFTSVLEVTSLSVDGSPGGANASSMSGGAVVTLRGRGFAPSGLANATTNVSFCNAVCTVTSASYDSLTCVTGSTLTPGAVQGLGAWAPGVLTGASVRGNTPAAVPNATDADPETLFSSCWIQWDMGESSRAIVTGVRWYQRLRGPGPFVSNGGSVTATWRGSNDVNMVNSTLLAAPTTTVEGWNNAAAFNGSIGDVSALPAFRYLRWSSALGWDCTAGDVAFVGYPVAAGAQASGDAVCPPVVTVSPPQVPPANVGREVPVTLLNPNISLTYALGVTPVVTGITPNNGTALGGDVVTLTGSGFGSVAAGVTVALNGVPCAVTSVVDYAITCVTGVRTAVQPVSVAVTIPGAGAAVVDASRTYFRYLDRWSALTTWKYNEPPVEGDTVVVPEGQALLVDVDPPRLNLVLVEGEMVFDRRHGVFDANFVLVYGGRLFIGTEAEPFLHNLTITLHGSRFGDNRELPEAGAKGFVVMDKHDTMLSTGDKRAINALGGAAVDWGRLYKKNLKRGYAEIHGKPRRRVWTKLAGLVPAGATVFTTSEPCDFAPGEVVVLTSSSTDMYEAEEVTIAARLSDNTYAVGAPFKYAHGGPVMTADETGFIRDVDTRGEVGLMSRNPAVVIQGDAEFSDAEVYGVHVAFMHGGVMRAENVEIRRCGQQGMLGRYCMHSHMSGQVPDSYVRFNSIHHSYQRACTVHATNYMRVQHNFAYRIHGHSIFVEDGVERANVIEENLVAVTMKASTSLRSDATGPSNFWASSPQQFWRHNVGAGSASASYWFEFAGTPNGPSANPDECPVTQQLGQFHNNTGHSSVFGLRIYPAWFPLKRQCGRTDLLSEPEPAFLTNSTFHHVGDRGIYWKRTGSVHVQGFAFVANAGFDIRMFHLEVPPTVAWIPHVQDALFICDPRGGRYCPPSKQAAVHMPANEDLYIDGAAFVNFGPTVRPLVTCNECDDPGANPTNGGFTTRTSRLDFVDTDRFVDFTPPQKEIIWDLDGSLTSRGANSYVVPPWGWNDFPDVCAPGGYPFDGAQLCGPGVEVRKVQVQAPITKATDYLPLALVSTIGTGRGSVSFRVGTDWTGWSFPVVTRRGAYNMSWVGWTGDWVQLKLRYSEREYTPPGSDEWTALQLRHAGVRYRNRVRYQGRERAGRLPPLDPLTYSHGAGVMTSPDNRTWAVPLNARDVGLPAGTSPFDAFTLEVTSVLCPPEGCLPPAPPPSYGNFSLWSSPATWPSGRVPIDGEDVVIPANLSVLLDLPASPLLRTVTVYGALAIYDDGVSTSPRTLNVENLVVLGLLVAGTRSAPYRAPGGAEIVFRGDYSGAPVRVDENLSLGNKVLVVLGTVSMVAPRPNVTWAKLAATAEAGATSVTLAAPVTPEWRVGDAIALGSTSYEHTETENATIAAISADGRTLTLAAPLLFRHFAGTVSNSSATGAPVTLAAPVGRLTRPLRLRGALASADDDYGVHVVVATTTIGLTAAGTRVSRDGRLELVGVELANCGQPTAGFPCVRAQYGGFPLAPSAAPSTNPVNVLDGVAMSNSLYTGVEAVVAQHLVLTNSVLHRGSPYCVDIDDRSGNATLTGNLFLGSVRRPPVPSAFVWFRPQSAVYALAPMRAAIGNVVSGAYDAAYTFFPDDCAEPAGGRVRDNEAVGARVGVFALSVGSTPSSCVAVRGFTLWSIAHLAITSVDQQQNVLVSRATIADAHIGVSINSVRVDQRKLSYVTVEDSTLLGTTAVSGFGANCTRNGACRAMSRDDPVGDAGCGSVLGTRYRRAGVMLPLFTNAAKTCGVAGMISPCRPHNTPLRACSMPWERRFGVQGAVSATTLYLTNVTFVGFGGAAECGSAGGLSKAIIANPSAVEHAPPVSLARVTFVDTPVAGRLDLSWTGGPEAQGAGTTAQATFLLQDTDGSLTGRPNSSVLWSNAALANPDCLVVPEWPGFHCPAVLRAAFIESMDSDAGTRLLGTLQAARISDPADNTTWRTANVPAPGMESCAKRTGASTYPFVAQPGLETRLYFPGTEPSVWRVHLMSPYADEAVVLRLWLQRRFTWSVLVDGAPAAQVPVVSSAVAVPPTVNDPPGTFTLDSLHHALWVTVRGGQGVTYDLVRQPAVQVTLALQMGITSFYLDDFLTALALSLGIPRWRIKTVSVAPAEVRRLRALAEGTPTFDEASGETVHWRVWRNPRAGRALQAVGDGTLLDVQILDDGNATTPKTNGTTPVGAGKNVTDALNLDDADSRARAQAAYDRLAALTDRIGNLTAAGNLTTVGNVTVGAVAVEAPPPPPPPPVKQADLLAQSRVVDVVNNTFTNGSLVPSATVVPLVVDPSPSSASTPTNTPSNSASASLSASPSASASPSPSYTPTGSATATRNFYVRGSGRAPPGRDMLLWLRPDGFTPASAGAPLARWPNAMDGAPAVAGAEFVEKPAARASAPVLEADWATNWVVPRFSAAALSTLTVPLNLTATPSWTVVLVARLSASTGAAHRRLLGGVNSSWALGTNGGYSHVALSSPDAGVTPATHIPGAPGNTTVPTSAVAGRWALYILSRDDDGTGWLWANGAPVGNGAPLAGPAGLRLSGSGGGATGLPLRDVSDCWVAELLVYRTSFGGASWAANTTRSDIEGYLGAKYGLPLPDDHPFAVKPSSTPSVTGSRSGTPTPTRSASNSPTRSITRSVTRGASTTSSPTRSPPVTPSNTVSASRRPTITPSKTRKASKSISNSRTHTGSKTHKGKRA